MYQIAQQPWSHTIDLRHISPMVKIGYKTVIITRLSGPGDELQNGHVILALYKGVIAMAGGKPGYYRLNAGIYLEKSLIGSVQIARLDYGLGLAARNISQVTDTLTVTTGKISDPKDPNTHIRYSFNGRTTSPQETLTAVLDGLAAVAQYAGSSLGSVTGRSFSGSTEFYVGGLFGQGVMARDVTRALYLIAIDLIVAFRLYMEMTFTLFISGKWTANGVIRLLPAEERYGTKGIASS